MVAHCPLTGLGYTANFTAATAMSTFSSTNQNQGFLLSFKQPLSYLIPLLQMWSEGVADQPRLQVED